MYSLYAVRGKMSKRGIKTLKGFVYTQNFSMFSLFMQSPYHHFSVYRRIDMMKDFSCQWFHNIPYRKMLLE